MNKRIMMSFALICMFVLIIPTIANAKYSDIEGHWCEKEINEFCDNHIIFGRTADKFEPDEDITKAEFCVAVNNMLEYGKVNSNDSEWKEKSFELGIEKGYMPIGAPDDTLTREETCVIIERMISGLTNTKKLIDYEKFSDYQNVSKWAKDSVEKMVISGKIIGYNDNTLRMKQKITRAELVIILQRCKSEFNSVKDSLSENIERKELVVGSIEENENGELYFKKINGEITLEKGDSLIISIEMPSGYEGQDTACEIISGRDYIEFDEYFYELTAKKKGKSKIKFYTLDRKYVTELNINVTN